MNFSYRNRETGQRSARVRVDFYVSAYEAAVMLVDRLHGQTDDGTALLKAVENASQTTIDRAVREGLRFYGYDASDRAERIADSVQWLDVEPDEVFEAAERRVNEIYDLS